MRGSRNFSISIIHVVLVKYNEHENFEYQPGLYGCDGFFGNALERSDQKGYSS